MQKIDKKVQLVIAKVEQMCGKSSDLSTRTIQMGSKNVAYLYLILVLILFHKTLNNHQLAS